MTTINDNSNDIPSVLGQEEMTAMEMKYEGFNCKEIAEKLGMNHGSVRGWFARGGKLYEYYIAYATEESELRKKEAHDTFKAHLNNAVRTLVSVMNKSRLDIARVAAAKEIINRQMGEPLKVIATDEGRVNEYLEAINKYKDAKTVPANVTSGEDTDITESTG
jgi:hypothetical protein